MYSNFVTYPDFVEDDFYNVLLVDPTQEDVENIALICKNVGTDFNIYIYLDQHAQLPWLEEAFNRSDTVLINTAPNNLSPVKDKLIQHPKAAHYGPKRFFDNNRRIEKPMEFFINYVAVNTKPFFDL